MTLNVCLGHKKTPEFTTTPKNDWLFPSQIQGNFPENIRHKLENTFFLDEKRTSVVDTDLKVRHGNTTVQPQGTFGRISVRFSGTIEILDPFDDKVLLTLRRK